MSYTNDDIFPEKGGEGFSKKVWEPLISLKNMSKKS
jgi:hypothetical protein